MTGRQQFYCGPPILAVFLPVSSSATNTTKEISRSLDGYSKSSIFPVF